MPAVGAQFRDRRFGVVAAAILPLALAGCIATPLPDLHVDLPTSWQQMPRPAQPGAPAADSRGWWHAFGDPELDALVEQALSANPDVAEAGARLRAARILQRHALDPLHPDLHLRTANPIDPDASASYLLAGFDSTWELGLFGRATAMRRLARADLDAADAQLDGARVSVAAEVAREWIGLRSAQQREILLARIRDAHARRVQRIAARLHLGLASPQEMAQAGAALAESEAAISEPRATVRACAQALAVLLGRSEPDPGWSQPGPLPRLGAWRMSGAPADLLRARPDVSRAEADVLRAAGELGIAKADRYPSIALGGSLQWSTSEIENRSTETNRIASFGPAIDIPLFDWGMRRARAQAKGELLQAAVLAYRKTVLGAVSEVETALAALEQQRLREQGNARALDALAQVVAGTERRSQLGLASGLDIAASEIDRDQAALQLLESRTARSLDYIALGKALGAADRDRVVTDAGGSR